MRNQKVKKMATVGLLMALVVLMQFLSGMIPPVSGFSISLVLIPIVLGSAMYGPGVGALLGATFGSVVFINCVNGADVGGNMVFVANPVLCFVVVLGKGILAGVASGWIYRLLKRKNSYIAMLCAAIVCPTVNTGVFVACMLTFFRDVLSVWAGGGELLAYILSGLMLANFLPELLINMVFSPAGQRIMHIVRK